MNANPFKKRSVRLVLVWCVTALVVVGSMACAKESKTADVAAMSSQENAVAKEKQGDAKPFMFNEASLPEGFPGVGPVDEVVVKKYPSYRLARVTAEQAGKTQDSMFRVLFNHIKRNDIKMTAPVEMEYPGPTPGEAAGATRTQTEDKPAGRRTQAASMAFLYGSQTWGQPGNDPGDARVEVLDVPAMTVVSVAVRGRYTDDRFTKAEQTLRDYISKNPTLKASGPPRYLGYNSPFVPWFLQIGEVQIPVATTQDDRAQPK